MHKFSEEEGLYLIFWYEEIEGGTKPSLNAVEVTQLQNELNVQFPKSYIERLKEKNGGRVIFNAIFVDFKNTWSEFDSALHLPFYAMEPLTYDTYNLYKGILPEWDIHGKNMIFAESEGIYWYYFNFSNDSNNPSIWCLDISDISNHFVAHSFDELLTKLYVQESEPLDLDDVFAGFPTMEEIYETVEGNDEDAILEAYSYWMSLRQDIKGLVRELIKKIEQSDDEDMLDAYAMYLTEMMVNSSGSESISFEEVISLFNKKSSIVNLNAQVSRLREEAFGG